MRSYFIYRPNQPAFAIAVHSERFFGGIIRHASVVRYRDDKRIETTGNRQFAARVLQSARKAGLTIKVNRVA